MNHKKIDNQLDARYEKYKGILKNLTMMNDVFMRNVFKKQECTEYVLQVIMGRKDLKVLDQVLQKDYKNLQGRSAILDCVVQDAEGKQFDVEIQQDAEGASPKRARYHSGLMDMNTLNPGQDFDELPETYVIFITRDDVLGYDLPIYHIERKIKEVQADFKDEAYIIYVNSHRQDDTELGRLMRDFHCKNAGDIHSEVLSKRVYELKESQEGVDFMSREMDEIYNEGEEHGRARGFAEGEMKKAKETALTLADRGMSVSDIADIVKVNVKLVQEWLSGDRSLAK
nr:PD-(D/E)XK nuclease family transposase [uncultured Anaerostipes sp.]